MARLHRLLLAVLFRAGTLSVAIIDVQTNSALAQGPVQCTGRAERHALTMSTKSPLAARRVFARFNCDGDTTDDARFIIWCVCS